MPVLHVIMDVGPYEERPSQNFPGCLQHLTQWLPGLYGHECSLGRPGEFAQRLQLGTYLPHICEHVAVELQTPMEFDVSSGAGPWHARAWRV
jgi:cyanophycin synthetase